VTSVSARAKFVGNAAIARFAFITVEASTGAVEAQSVAVAIVRTCCDFTGGAVEAIKTKAKRLAKATAAN